MNKLLDMISAGVEDGSLARFVFVLLAAFLLAFLTISGNLGKPDYQFAVGLCTIIIGFYFGANGKPKPPVGGAAA